MAIQWLRLWHEMPNDPKWRTIARVSQQPIPSVMAVYVHLLVIASNATERGRTTNVCGEDIASALDIELEQVEQILLAMQGRVLDGERISGWESRQVEREDGSAARAKAWREAQKQTQPNAAERKRTPDKDKDKDKDKDIEKKTLGATGARGSRMPADFEPDLTFAAECGIANIAQEVAKFTDYWSAVPGHKGIKLDWPATWRNWCRNAKKASSTPQTFAQINAAIAGVTVPPNGAAEATKTKLDADDAIPRNGPSLADLAKMAALRKRRAAA